MSRQPCRECGAPAPTHPKEPGLASDHDGFFISTEQAEWLELSMGDIQYVADLSVRLWLEHNCQKARRCPNCKTVQPDPDRPGIDISTINLEAAEILSQERRHN